MADVLVAGCGLIGTSVALGVRQAGRDVVLHDVSGDTLAQAVGREAGRPWDGREAVELAVVAVPPRLTAHVLLDLQSRDVARTYTHVASVQSHVQAQVESLSRDPSQVVGGHPLAGRERSGPLHAAADLFVGRPWAVCRGAQTSHEAVARLRRTIDDLGADAVELTPQAHDAAVALLSHLPQLASSALAASLVDEDGSADGREDLVLAGPGLVDTTRLAASDPALWVQILQLNAACVAPLARDLGRRLLAAGDALAAIAEDPLAGKPSTDAAGAVDALTGLLRAGNAGRARVPVKRGSHDDAFEPVRVTVSDEPGRLAALLTDAGSEGVNVEDVRVDHVPGRPTGVIELLVARHDTTRLRDALHRRGWAVAKAVPSTEGGLST